MASFPATSLGLLARAQARQEEAWRRLVELYGPLVFHWCRRAGLGDDDTADVFQEVFQAVSQHLPRYRHDRSGDTFRGWLRTICRNKIRDHFRAAPAQGAGGSEALRALHEVPDPLPDDEADDRNWHARQVGQVLAWIEGDFDPRTWRAFHLTRVENRPTADVAQELGMTSPAVRKAAYRVLQRLREELAGLGLEPEGNNERMNQ